MASQIKLRARADPVLKRLPIDEPRLMAEIGLFVGDLAEDLLGRRPLLTHIGVDNWIGTDQQPEDYKATGDIHAVMPQMRQDELYQKTINRLKRFKQRSTIHRMASLDAAELVDEGSLDLVFIDADHSYSGCLADCWAWWPKVKPGGWLSGHDYLNSDRRFTFGVNQAVDEFVAKVERPLRADGGTTWFIRKPCAL